MIIISAMSKNRVIGVGSSMPWQVPAEYQQYLEFIRGNLVIFGRKSYEIFGPDLPGDTTPVVVSRSRSYRDVCVVQSLADALSFANGRGKKVFVAGGATIYEQSIPFADEMYLSTIKGDFYGDAYFPQFNAADWAVVEFRSETDFDFRKYKRIRRATFNGR